MKKHIHIEDALKNLQNELNTDDALVFMLWEKAHYFLNLSEDAGKAIERAQKEYQNLSKAALLAACRALALSKPLL